MLDNKVILEVVKTELQPGNPKLAAHILTFEGFMKWCENKDITFEDIKQSYINEITEEYENENH